MSIRVILASPDRQVVSDVLAVASETDAFEVVQTVGSAGELRSAVSGGGVDIVLLHEELGPLPVLDIGRDLANHAPTVGLVLLAREQSAELLAGALRAGFRGVVRLPIQLEDLQSTVASTGSWAQQVHERVRLDEAEESAGRRMIAVAGAKGGVGTTTIAVHLALAAVAGQRRTVCLVDFDMQTGDVRSLLNLTNRRSVGDLTVISEELSPRQIEESLTAHPSGLRVLLPPTDGEQGEDVVDDLARRVLGALRTRFDLVLVDVGSVVTEAGAVATEMADEVLTVTTPDVPSLKGANRLLALWERMQIRKEGIRVVVNRASRDGEVQPDLVAKIVGTPLMSSVIPANFRSLEAAANTGLPENVVDGPATKALARLAEELHLAPRRTGSRRMKRGSQQGQAAAETVGLVLLIGIIVLILWEMVLVGYTFILAGHASREGARELAVTTSGEQKAVETIARSDLPDGWRDSLRVELDGEEVTVHLDVPILAPGARSAFKVSTTAETVKEVRVPSRVRVAMEAAS